VRTQGELDAIGDGLTTLLARVTALVEESQDDARDDVLELVAVERGLSATLRRLQRLAARARS
jgi:hypothetical protein